MNQKEGVMMDKALSVTKFKSVSGKPCVWESFALRRPAEAELGPVLAGGTASKWHMPCWSVCSPGHRQENSSSQLHAIPLASQCFFWDSSSSSTPVVSQNPNRALLGSLLPLLPQVASLKGRYRPHFQYQHLRWRICGNLSAEAFVLHFALYKQLACKGRDQQIICRCCWGDTVLFV